MRRGTAWVLILVAGSILPAATPRKEASLSDQAREGYRLAVEAADGRQFTKALARLDGLLMRAHVSVGIDAETLPKEPTSFADGVKQGLAIWAASISDSPFRMANPGESPALHVRFVDEVHGSTDVQGMISARREFQWSNAGFNSKVSGTIQIVRHTDGRLLTRDEVAEVVAHELGHLLGLDDVDGTTGLMGAFVGGEPRTSPTAAEIELVVGYRKVLREASAMVHQRLTASRRLAPQESAAIGGRNQEQERASCRCSPSGR